MMTKYFPLTSPQREIWFDQILHDTVPYYNRTRYIKILGNIDAALIEQAIHVLIKKHDILRTHLTETQEDGLPRQHYLKTFTFQLPVHDFSTDSEADKKAQQWMLARSNELFEMINQPLFRYDLIKVSDEYDYFLMQYHHLIIDGYGMAQLSRSLAEIYTQLSQGLTPELNAPSYTDFIEHDTAYIQSDIFAEHKKYWLNKYPQSPELLLNPRYITHYAGQKLINGASCTQTMSRSFYQQLSTLAKQHQVTFFRVYLAVLYVYFTRTGQRDDFAISYPTLNRTKEFRQTAGIFSLVNASLFKFGRALTFAELLQKIDQEIIRDLTHQPFPSSDVNRMVNQGQARKRSALFDIGVSYQRFNFDATFNGIDTETTQILYSWEQTPLMIHIEDFNAQAEVKFHFVYNLAYFKAQDIKALQLRLMTLLESVVDNSQRPITDLPLMPSQEILQLQTWNETLQSSSHTTTFIELFENQVTKTPHQQAVIFQAQTLSYHQLNTQSNQLAHALLDIKNTLDPLLFTENFLVVVALERSLEILITVLAVLKAGGAYIPVDPSYPEARVRHMIEDSAAPLLLTQRHLKTTSPIANLAHKCSVIAIEDILLDQLSTANPALQIHRNDLAYILYTSGSTGKPKGVMIEHHSVLNFLQDMQQRIKITAEDKLLAVTTLSFDIATLELYLPLITGGSLYLSDQAISDSFVLQQQLKEHQISVMQATPATWQLLKHSEWKAETPLTILCGGEALPPELANYLLDNSRQCWNVYGPTETTVWSTAYRLQAPSRLAPFIGKPIANTQIYIIDDHFQLLPIGEIGELCIAGEGLSRGYFNRPDLTAEKFIHVPWLADTDKIYRTGDLARWTHEGDLECLGRIDHQVKIRGFRIELGDIEANLCEDKRINEAVVMVNKTSDHEHLITYVTLKNADVSVDDLLLGLKQQLPDYMIPAHMIILDAFPLTPNGKINRYALPAPDTFISSSSQEAEKICPTTLVEERLAQIWMDILNIDAPQLLAGASEIDIHQDFFAMGGHSLNAARLVTQLQKTFQIKLPLICLFENPTIATLAHYIDSQTRLSTDTEKPWTSIVPLQQGGDKKPLFIMPGGASGEKELVNLVKLTYLLGKDQPVYGLQARGWDGLSQPHASVQALAADCVTAIRTVQTEGSYLLMGECLGGKIMLEIAQQLQIQGQEIAFLALIETRLHQDNLTLATKIKSMTLTKFKQRSARLLRRYTDKYLPQTHPKNSDAPPKISPEERHFNLVYAHQISRYQGELTLMMTAQRHQDAPKLGWNSLATGKVNYYELPDGQGHTAYLGKEVVATAKILATCLKELNIINPR